MQFSLLHKRQLAIQCVHLYMMTRESYLQEAEQEADQDEEKSNTESQHPIGQYKEQGELELFLLISKRLTHNSLLQS